jgi:hypothetical protein
MAKKWGFCEYGKEYGSFCNMAWLCDFYFVNMPKNVGDFDQYGKKVGIFINMVKNVGFLSIW